MKKRILSASLIILAASCEPWFAIDFCGRDQCDDGDECTIDVCIERHCEHFEAEESADGGCVQYCYTTADCDDGKFCNGEEYCSNGICERHPSDCTLDPGLTLCDEVNNRCYQCDRNADCGVDQWCSSGLCIGYCPNACGSEDLCRAQYCFEGTCLRSNLPYCNQGERCDPGTGICVPVGHLCLTQCDISDRSCCAIDSPGCDFQPQESFDSFSASLARWQELPCDEGSNNWAVAGTCADGTLVLRGWMTYDLNFHTVFFSAAGDFQSMMTDFGSYLPDNCDGHGYWPIKPTCHSMMVEQVICGARYRVGEIAYFDPCRSQCDPYGCPEVPIESFPDFDGTIKEWSNSYCSYQHTTLLSGICESGMQFVHLGQVFEVERRFFDVTTLAFIAKTFLTDYSSETYWPIRVTCENPKVTQVLCGSGEVGESFYFPEPEVCYPYSNTD